MLALAEAGDGIGIAGVNQKLESSDAFERDDFSVAKGRGRVGDGAVELWATDWAGVGLSVEAAVGGIFVFFAAGRAEGESPHRRVGAVVGNVDDDGVARATIGAVGEGIF